MKLIKTSSYLLLLFVVVTASCNKALESHEPLTYDPTPPSQVSNVIVTNGPGNATITYTVPNDPLLLYVKAVYKISSGQQYEAKASYYNNSLKVEGFADTLEHEVQLFSVSRSEVESAPITIKIKPLKAPIWEVFQSLLIQNAFGGYNLSALNLSRSNISIIVIKKNAFNEYEPDNDQSVYTETDSILSKIRGLDTIDYRFGFYVKDRWGNKTDTLFKDIKPIYETQLANANFSPFTLPGDAPQWNNGETRVEYMWDGRYGWPWTVFTPQSAGPQPHMVTFSTGILARLSRIWIRPYPEGTRFYYLTTMKHFEIWGSSNPNLNGDLDNTWTLLGTYNVVKPSGLPYGTDDANDQATASAGFDWEVDITAPRVKYIRIRCLENFAGGTAMSVNELKVYGDPR